MMQFSYIHHATQCHLIRQAGSCEMIVSADDSTGAKLHVIQELSRTQTPSIVMCLAPNPFSSCGNQDEREEHLHHPSNIPSPNIFCSFWAFIPQILCGYQHVRDLCSTEGEN